MNQDTDHKKRLDGKVAIVPGRNARGFSQLVALKRYGTNEEVANLALFLASDESSYLHRINSHDRRRIYGRLV